MKRGPAFVGKALGSLLLLLVLLSPAVAQHDKDEEPTSHLSFLVIKDENGKPIRNAAVIMHSVGNSGKQARGGMELKTDGDGKTSFDGIPYGTLRVQVLASGYQTFGEDYDVQRPAMSFTIKLKQPQNQYSLYEGHSNEKKDGTTPPPDPNGKPPQ
jgi:hypothetical protein